jgi:ATP-dependent RNA helicase DHX29
MDKLFWLQRPRQTTKKLNGLKNRPPFANKGQLLGSEHNDLEEAKLLAKIDRIEQDILFDKPLAEHMWRNRRIELEKEFASNASKAEQEKDPDDQGQASGPEDDIAKEAERMTAEILQQDDSGEDQSLSDLFGSLPFQETDATGKTSTVVNGPDGFKVTIRDFGKWSGVSPTRALEEACRSRYIVPTRNKTLALAYTFAEIRQ